MGATFRELSETVYHFVTLYLSQKQLYVPTWAMVNPWVNPMVNPLICVHMAVPMYGRERGKQGELVN